MEIRKLCANDYDELLEMLNYTFGTSYGRGMDFLNEQPNMWVRDDEHLGKHLAVFDGGRLASVVGIYPLTAVIDGTEVLFATTGNVATHPDFTGKGYFTELFTRIMAELDVIDADGARLGGARQRYARFGFEPRGTLHKFMINERNRKALQKKPTGIEFKAVDEHSLKELEYIDKLSKKSLMYVKRSPDHGYRNAFLNLCSKHARPYIAIKNGEFVGYLSTYADNQFIGRSTNGRHIAEMRAESTELFRDIVFSWQERCNADVNVPIAPFMKDELKIFSAIAQSMTSTIPSYFKFRRFERVADALMRVKAKSVDIPDGEFTIEIADYGKICLYNKNGNAGCEKTNIPSLFTLSKNDAQRLLFGPYSPEAICDLPWIAHAFLPLPLTWNTNDYT